MSKFHLSALLACAITAQPLIAETCVIVTLDSIGDRIRSQNPDLAAARLGIREAIGRAKQSGRLSNPELETSFEGKPKSREGNFEIGFSQKFMVTNRLRLEKEISATGIQAAEAEVREVELRLITEARQLAVKLLSTRERRALLKQQVELADEFAAFLAASTAKGEGSALDAGQAKLEANSLALEFRQIDVEETSLLGELKPLLGMKPGEALVVSGNMPAASPPPRSSDPGRRPDYQVARLEEQAAATNVALEQARRYDDIEGGLFTGVERMEDAPEGYENEALVGLRFKFALPFWNRNEGAIEEAEATRERKQKETAALAANILLEADATRAEMGQWAGVLREIQETLLPLAEAQASLAEAAYRDGQGEIQSVLRAREKRLQLSAAKLDALREFHLARVRHESSLGN